MTDSCEAHSCEAQCGRRQKRREACVSLWVLCLWLLGATAPVQAQDAALQQARAAYQNAEYERAIDLFAQIAQDTGADQPTRREALQYLGRAYVARSQEAKAREAIHALLELEPPLIEFDPDVEPPPLMKLYYQARKDGSGGYEVERRDPGLRTLAIMDFTNSSVDENQRFAPLQKGFPSMMINYLRGATDLKVIERERIQWLLDELKLQQQGEIVDQSTAVRTGKLLGAHAVVFGSYTVHRDRMWLSARVVNVETSEVLLAEQIFGDKDEFFELVQKLSLQAAKAVNVSLDETRLGSRTETRSLDAMMAYSDGLAFLEEGAYRAAHEKFLEAQGHDPDYKQAEIKAMSLRPMLAADAGASLPSNTNR